jgi:chromosome segregation ATPase
MWSNNDGMDPNWRPDFPAKSDKDAEIAKLKAEIGNREGEKQEMREVIDRLKAEVEQYKKAAHLWEMNWAQLRAELSEEKTNRERDRQEWLKCMAEVKSLEATRESYDLMLCQTEKELASQRAENERLKGTLMRVDSELRLLAKHHLEAAGNLTHEQKVWAHDTLLVAAGWIDRFVTRQALQSAAKLDEGNG